MPQYPWERPTMDGFLREAEERFSNLFNLPIAEITDAIRSACAFFGLSYPKKVLDISRMAEPGTRVYPMDPTTDEDDILFYDLRELMALRIRNKESFSLIMTHECAHRYFQGWAFQGRNNGQWEQELACDFFMGARAAIEGMNPQQVINALGSTSGADTHPDGDLREDAIIAGYNVVQDIVAQRTEPCLANYIKGLNEFLYAYRPTIHQREEKYFPSQA